MSRRVFGKAAKDLTLAESALIAGLARAPATLSPWSNLDGAIARSHVVLARMRDGGFIDAAARARGPAGADPRAARIAATSAAPARLRQGLSPAALPRRVRRRPSARLARRHHLRRGAPGRRRGGGDARARPARARRRCRRRWSRIDPAHRQRPGAGRRPRLQRIGLQPRQPQPPPARVGLQAVRLRRGARTRLVAGVRCCAGSIACRRRGPTNGRRATSTTMRPTCSRCGRRCSNRTTGPRRCCSSRWDRRRGAASGRAMPGSQDLPDVPSLALGTGLVTPLAMTAAFAIFPNGGLAVRPRDITRVRDADGSTALARPTSRPSASSRRRWRSRWCRCSATSSIAAPARRRGGWACGSRPAARPAPPTTSRTPGSSASRRRWSPACGWASISREPIGARRLRGALRPADLGRLHAAGGAGASARTLRAAGRPARRDALCASATGSRWTAVRSTPSTSRTATRCPSGLCPLHRGTIRQRVARAVQGWFEDSAAASATSSADPPAPQYSRLA